MEFGQRNMGELHGIEPCARGSTSPPTQDNVEMLVLAVAEQGSGFRLG